MDMYRKNYPDHDRHIRPHYLHPSSPNSVKEHQMKYRNMFFICLIVITLALAMVIPVFARSLTQDNTPPPSATLQTIMDVATSLATLAGVAALISVIVNVLKYFQLVPDGMAGRVFALLNLIAFVILAAMRVFAPQYSLSYLDAYAAQIATVGLFISGYLFQLGIGQQAYQIIQQANIPILSHSTTFTNWQKQDRTPPVVSPDSASPLAAG